MVSTDDAPQGKRNPVRALSSLLFSKKSDETESIQLRTATLILPRTGERVKRVVTLRAHSGDSATSDQDAVSRSPLLTHRRQRRRSIAGKIPKLEVLKYESAIRWKQFCAFWASKTGQGIIKCSIAYLLGSMATFIPFLSQSLGHMDGKHMAATVTVYFHPARSQGSMFEAVLMALCAFAYAAFIAFTSMGVTVWFDERLDLLVLGHVVVLLVFCGGGLGLVGWVKQKMGNPLVNVACSLTSLAIITVLTKEESVLEADFSTEKIAQVFKLISIGVISTTAVCFIVRPVSARKELRQNILEITECYGDMLAMITRGFLTGSEEELEQRGFQEATDRYKASYTAMTRNHKESKWEHYVFGTERVYKLEAKLVNCVQRLAQNIGGLRSAAKTQFTLLSQSHGLGGSTPLTSIYTPTTAGLLNRVDSWMSNQENFAVLESIAEHSEDGLEDSAVLDSDDTGDGLPTVRTPTEIFERFIMHLGPSLKSLAFTLQQILEELPYGPAPDFKIEVNANFRSSLMDAIDLYSNARKESLDLVYRNRDMAMSRNTELEADFEEVAASCGYFSFSLQDFAEEMKIYLDILDELKDELEAPRRKRSWSWLKFWRKSKPAIVQQSEDNDLEQDNLIVREDATDEQHDQRSPIHRDLASVLQPERPSRKMSISYRIWKASRFFRRDDIRFAIKVGAGAALFALPSFLDDTRPIYSGWRGEWGLLSYMLVCSMTIGASNTTGLSRAFGTVLGAVCAVLAWEISSGNVFGMAFFGWAMALFCFYLIVGKGKGPLGRFILLTYNLSALYAYSLSVKDDEDDDDEGGIDPVMTSIALHRVVAVLAGCFWGLIVTRLVWPISARRKFQDGLTLLLLRMGLIWRRDPLATLLEGEAPHPYMNLREELQVQRYLGWLDGLRASAAYEFELKGPFAADEFTRILRCVGRMLDAFHAMNVVIMKDPQASEGEVGILKYTAEERAQLGSRISHLFQGMTIVQFPCFRTDADHSFSIIPKA